MSKTPTSLSLKSPKLRFRSEEMAKYYQLQQANLAPDFQNLTLAQDRLKYLSQDILQNLDRYLLEFEKKFIDLGGILHWAEDSQGAIEIIQAQLREHSIPQSLWASGPIMKEVDLGDLSSLNIPLNLQHYVEELSLKEFSPSALAQAIQTQYQASVEAQREAIVGFFEQEIQRKISPDYALILAANFMIPETGVLNIAEDELRATQYLSKSKLNFIIIGLDQIAPLEHLDLFWALQGKYQDRSQVPLFQSLLSPTYTQAPLQVIILDNGRTKLLESEHLKDILRCIHCGACASVCPLESLLQKKGERAFPGPAGSLVEEYLSNEKQSLNQYSTLCGACGEVCPVGIDLPKLLETQRRTNFSTRKYWKKWFLEKLGIDAYLRKLQKIYFS